MILPLSLRDFLEEKYNKFNNPSFISDDPICIPHFFSKKQDIEIMGFWAAILAWGQRKTIIAKCKELVSYMDGSPHEFVLNHSENDLKPFLQFKHRTFNNLDALYFIAFFKNFYLLHHSLEEAFVSTDLLGQSNTEIHLVNFHKTFFSLPDVPDRTRKHVSSPVNKSACKRINMFLRWMVRMDDRGVDFGIWKKITPSQLVCPCDLHVDRVARRFGLITRQQTDWLTAIELTENLKQFDAEDPVKYDFALFGMGTEEITSF